MHKVVYDTNMIFSAALKEKGLPDLLLSLVLEDKVRLFISEALLEEYQCLSRKRGRDYFLARDCRVKGVRRVRKSRNWRLKPPYPVE